MYNRLVNVDETFMCTVFIFPVLKRKKTTDSVKQQPVEYELE